MAEKPFLDVSNFSIHWEHSSRKDDCQQTNCPGLNTGAAIPGKANILPDDLYFGDTYINSNSSYQTVTVQNIGKGNLVIKDIQVVGDFTAAVVEKAPITLLPGKSIEVLVYFRPRETGARTGGIYFDTGDAAGEEFVSLHGSGLATDDDTGTDPEPTPTKTVTVTPALLAFGGVDSGGVSTAKTVTVKNETDATITVNSITVSDEFTQTNNCGSTLTAGSSCIIQVIFAPKSIGTKTGVVTFTYDTNKSKTVTLSGTGTDPVSNLPTLSITDGVLTSGEQIVAFNAYPDGATISEIKLPSVMQGTSSLYDFEIVAVGTDNLQLTNLPSIAGDFTIQYADTYGAWETVTDKTITAGNKLYCRVSAANSLASKDYTAQWLCKINGLSRALPISLSVSASPEIVERISINGNQFYKGTNTFRIKAVNWFGTEGTNYTPNGTWVRRYTDIVDQIKQMGFNTIRLPLSGEVVQSNPLVPSTAYDAKLNPEFVDKSALDILDTIIDYCSSVGIYIVLDHHRRTAGDGADGSPVSDTYPISTWLSTWTILASRYRNKLNVIGADIHNEPYNLTWDTWVDYATQCGNNIHATATDWLIFIEGVGSYQDVSYWWGGQLAGVKDNPVKLSLANRVAYSPHEYGQSVGNQSWLAYEGKTTPDNWPNNLATVWDNVWGFIYYNQIAPVWIGEFGGHFGVDGSGNLTKPNKTEEQQWVTQLVKYLNFDRNLDDSISDTEQVNTSWAGISYAYWGYNPNSADTGGLVQDDWSTPQTVKLNLLRNLF